MNNVEPDMLIAEGLIDLAMREQHKIEVRQKWIIRLLSGNLLLLTVLSVVWAWSA